MPSAPVAKKSSRTPQRVASRAGRRAPELIFGDLWAFDPAPESADPKLKPRYDLFINGKFVAPKGGKYFDSINPANERKLAEIALAGPADVSSQAISIQVQRHAEIQCLIPSGSFCPSQRRSCGAVNSGDACACESGANSRAVKSRRACFI